MLQELEGLKESLSFYKDSLSQVRLLCDAKDKELQVKLSNSYFTESVWFLSLQYWHILMA